MMDKIRDIIMWKGAKMTLEKAINMYRTDEITKMQMKEVSNDNEVNDISKKKLRGEPNQVVMINQKSGPNRSNDEKNVKQ